MSTFQCKGFALEQGGSDFKIGTDSILMAAYLSHPDPKRVLDIGSGTGILALQAAYVFPEAEIVAVELDDRRYRQCCENVNASRFSARIQVLQGDVLGMDFDERFDLIISNPPFHMETIHSPRTGRHTGRSTSLLPLDRLFAWSTDKLAKNTGRLQCIWPESSIDSFLNAAAGHQMVPEDIIHVHSKAQEPPIRRLITLTFNEKTPTSRSLMIYAGEQYSPAYIRFTSGVYGKNLGLARLSVDG